MEVACDLNTADPRAINVASSFLYDLPKRTGIKILRNIYNDIIWWFVL